MCEQNTSLQLQTACAQLDIKSCVTKTGSIKPVLEFYKSIKLGIVCVYLSSHQISQAAAAPEAHMASPQHPQKAPTSEWERAGVLVLKVHVCFYEQLQNKDKTRSLFCMHGKRCLTEKSIS